MGQNIKLHHLYLAPRWSFAHVCSKLWILGTYTLPSLRFNTKLLWSHRRVLVFNLTGNLFFGLFLLFRVIWQRCVQFSLRFHSISVSCYFERVCFTGERWGRHSHHASGKQDRQGRGKTSAARSGPEARKSQFLVAEKVSSWQILKALINNFVFILTFLLMGGSSLNWDTSKIFSLSLRTARWFSLSAAPPLDTT